MIITKEAKPPPDPSFILRAHEKDVSALLLANDDSLLISGLVPLLHFRFSQFLYTYL